MENKLLDLENFKSGDNFPTNGLKSVREGKVYYGHPKGISKAMLEISVETVCCIEHGAMLSMANWDKGTLWRCPTCNEGAIEEILK